MKFLQFLTMKGHIADGIIGTGRLRLSGILPAVGTACSHKTGFQLGLNPHQVQVSFQTYPTVLTPLSRPAPSLPSSGYDSALPTSSQLTSNLDKVTCSMPITIVAASFNLNHQMLTDIFHHLLIN